MRRSVRLTAVTVLGLLALLLTTRSALAADVVFHDDGNVLSASDRQSIQSAATHAPFSVVVDVANGGYVNNRKAFINGANAMLPRDGVVVAVDPVDHWSHVAATRNTGLSASATQQAESATQSDFAAGRYANGIVSAVQTLATAAPNGNRSDSVSNGTSAIPLIVIVLILLIVTGGIVFLFRRLRGAGGGYAGTGYAGPGPGYGGPGYGGPGYGGPGYGGPGYGGSGGMGNVAAGGLGALGGGVIGYELGKEAGERDQGGFNQGGYNDGSGGDQGGFVQSDDGGGNTPDFGGGGGGDSGGGGGGGDF